MSEELQEQAQEPEIQEQAQEADSGGDDDLESLDEAVLAELFDDAPEQEEAKEEPASEEPKTTDTPAEGAKADPDVDKALTALKREKLIPQEVLDSMTPEQVLAAGKAAEERIAEQTRQWQELNELKKQQEDTDAPEEPSQESGQPLDAVEWSQPFVEDLGEELGERLRDLFITVNQMQQQQFNHAEQEARRRVGERFLGLLDEDIYQEKVGPKMQSLAKSGDYSVGALDALMEDAARLLGLDEADPSAGKKSATSNGRKRRGLPVHSGRRTVQSISPENLDDEIAQAIFDGDNRRLADLTGRAR